MPESKANRSGAPGSLSRARLVEHALALLEDAGLPGLSTRKLAERLEVKSPALYWHVRHKDELLQLVADAICSQMALPDEALPYRTRLEVVAREYRRVLTAHRDAARLFAEQPPTGPHRMKLYDVAVGAFRDAGFSLSEAVALATFFRHYLLGMVTEEVRGQGRNHDASAFPPFALGVALLHLDDGVAGCPNLSGAATVLTDLEPDRLFEMGLKILLDGVVCRVGETARRRTTQAR